MNDRRVFISGVSSGIGLALARHYLGRGHIVMGVSRRQPAELCREPRFHFRSLDLTAFESVPSAVADLIQEGGGWDLAVLNAGQLGRIADLREQDLASLNQVLDINLWANKVLIDTLVASLEGFDAGVRTESKSVDSSTFRRQMVTISSGASVNGHRGWGGYSLSKAALNMLTKLYASELPSVHLTAVAPGLVDTAMQAILCGGPRDPRFPSVDQLRARRGTDAMPDAETLAERLADFIDSLPQWSESGGFVDIRDHSVSNGNLSLDG